MPFTRGIWKLTLSEDSLLLVRGVNDQNPSRSLLVYKAGVKWSLAMSELTIKSHRQGECRTGLGRPLLAQMVLLVLLLCPELFV